MSRKLSREEREVLQIVAQLRVLEGLAGELQARMGIVDAALTELKASSDALAGLRGVKKGVDLYVPIGGGSYVPAKLASRDRVLVGVGAGVTLEKGLDEALEGVRMRATELEKSRIALERRLVEVLRRMEELRRKASELSAKIGEKRE